ncbi:heterokaryon incompatibility protein-domain-containing protein [Xylaria curta]|nr:heterokaryon incompatibility protein-domain-containing protein [Xylaria curta]
MASAHQSTYDHQPLTLPKSIRVMIVKPAVSLEAPVECTLDEVDLDNLIPSSSYEALSYVWGERFGTVPILCHGRKLLVTPNCYDALVHLRLPSKHRRLFVDAICIDQRQDLQRSINERDHQIAIMGNVYERARQVIIWLGKPHPSTPELMSAMRFIYRADRIQSATKIKLRSIGAKAYIKWLKGLRNVDLVRLEEAFAHFIKNPWFTRIWTLQEESFAASENLVIVYGYQQIKYNLAVRSTTMTDLWKLLGEIWSHEGGSIQMIDERSFMAHSVRKSIKHDAELFRLILDPETFLEQLAALDSTNPRDKIFGVYNIFARLGLNLPQPNSSKSVAKIFEGASREIIRSTASLKTLILCFRESSTIKDLPSWVPDWSMKRPSRTSPIATSASHFLNTGKYKATRNTGAEINEASNLGKLVVRGTVLTKIHFCTASSTIGTIKKHINAKASLYFRDFIQACRRWVGHITILSSGCPSIDVIRRTLLLSNVLGIPRSKSRQRHRLESFSECFDIIMYPNCKTYDSAVIKAKFFDPVLEMEARDGVINTGFDIERVVGRVLYRWQSGDNTFPSKIPDSQNRDTFVDVVRWANYALMVLDTGHFARGIHTCKEGDIVALLAGCDFPVALRPDGNGNYRFVAPLYVVGIMNGEAWPEDESKLEEITLV